MWAATCVVIVVLCVFRAWRRSGQSWADFLILRGAFVYCRLLHRWSARVRHSFPKQGPAIIVCNHTCSADATFVLAGSDRLIGFLVASEHFNIHPIAHAILKHIGCIPVVRTGQDPVALRRALTRLAMGDLVCLFPEGNLSGVGLGRHRPPKLGAAFLALITRLPVYPVYISGGPRTDQLLKSWILPTCQAVRVVFGEPIDLSVYFDRPRTRPLLEEVSLVLMEKVVELAESE
jgi:1-acyl-sn-glycerol-3-phosphate acyltransferase